MKTCKILRQEEFKSGHEYNGGQEMVIREGEIHFNCNGTLSVDLNINCTPEKMYTLLTEVHL